MEKTLDVQIADARLACKKANEHLDSLMAKKNEYPRLAEKAKLYVIGGHSDKYIQSMLYASRTANIGINDIVEIIAGARNNCNTASLKSV